MSPFQNSVQNKSNVKPLKVNGNKSMKMLLVEDSNLLREVLFDTINNLKNLSVEGMAATKQQQSHC